MPLLRCRNLEEGGPCVAAEDTLACRGITHYWSLGQNEDTGTTGGVTVEDEWIQT
jgi:hypothetical protein